MVSTLKTCFIIFCLFFNIISCAELSKNVVEIPGYTYYPQVNKHYKFFNTTLTWFEARRKCLSQNGNLAMPENVEEANTLVSIWDDHLENDGRFIFLGFHDAFSEGEYVLDDGSSIQYYYHKWANKQPDNYRNEDCGSLTRSGELNDLTCEGKYPFICQIDDEISARSIKIPSCHENDPAYVYEPKLEKYYKIHLNPKPWSAARVICEAEGSQLAFIDSKVEEDFLVSMFNKPENAVSHVPHKEYMWLGFHDLFHEGHFVTVSGKDLTSMSYVRWSTRQPDNNRNEDCGSMHSSGGLNDLTCDFPAVFICEKDIKLELDNEKN